MIPHLALALAQGAALLPAHEELPRVRPNVLLVVVDDLGVEHVDWHPVGRLASNYAPTPFLSSMASEALVFVEAYGAPICTPARASLLTGRYPFRSGMGGNVGTTSPGLPYSEITLAEQLAVAGYATGGFGKWHLSVDRDDPNLQGFQHFDGSMSNLGFGGSGGYFSWTRVVNGTGFTETGYATTVVTDSAEAWIRQQNENPDPWFAYVAYHAPHKPFEYPPLALDPITQAQPGHTNDVIYQGMVEALDTELSRLLSVVDTRDTLVILVGDNGSSKIVAQYPVGKTKCKSTAYQGGILVPAMVWGATVSRKGEQLGPIHLVDFFRTILDAARAPGVGVQIDSLSLLDPAIPPMLRWAPRRQSLFTEHFTPLGTYPFGPHTVLQRALLGQRYKLLTTDLGQELYDLQEDPWEQENLLAGPLTSEQLQALVDLDEQMNLILGL